MPTIKTRRKQGWIGLAFHWTMMIFTVGLWTPFFLAARRRRVTVTHVPTGYGQPPTYGPPVGAPQPPPYGYQPPPTYGPRR